jgi:hypothetical protein
MSSYFQTNRDVELSTIYYLETQIDASWSNVEVTKMMPNVGKTRVTSLPDRPIVVARLLEQDTSRFEVGNTRLSNKYNIIIDIFARSDGQRIDLAGFILDKLKDSWTYYEHSHTSGDPTSLDRSADGKILVDEFMQNRKIQIFDNPEEFDKFRHFMSIIVRRSNFK